MSLWLYTIVYIVFIVHHHNQHLYTCIHCVCYYHLHLCHNHCVPCLYTAVSIYLFYCFYPCIHYCRCTIVYILLSLCLYTLLFHNFVHSSCRVQQTYLLLFIHHHHCILTWIQLLLSSVKEPSTLDQTWHQLILRNAIISLFISDCKT